MAKRKKFRTQTTDQNIIKEQPNVAYISETNEWIKSRTNNQSEYIKTIRENTITVAIGPAGTGKTFLAVAVGLQYLKEGRVNKIIITRPVVEAGEKLGFLPGDLQEKIDPYLRPIYDALSVMLGTTKEDYFRRDQIEIAPLAYMRGRTLENCYIILDEAQNATVEQVELLLTRTGFGSKVVITGDITQIDLPKRKESGLVTLQKIIGNIKGIIFHQFSEGDVCRHSIVKEIIKAYEVWKASRRLKYV